MNPERRQALIDVNRERNRQDAVWPARHPDCHSPYTWRSLLATQAEKATLAYTEGDVDAYRLCMVRVAALALAAVEAHDRKQNAAGREADRQALERGAGI